MKNKRLRRMVMSTKKIEMVYVAGPLTPKGIKSANPAIEYLLNARDLIRYSIEVLLAGFTPYCPGADFSFFLLLREGERITEPMIKRLSKDFLRRCDAILMTEGWQKSPGSVVEKELAEELGFPVFYSLKELVEYNDTL
jgi:hypothetical protein